MQAEKTRSLAGVLIRIISFLLPFQYLATAVFIILYFLRIFIKFPLAFPHLFAELNLTNVDGSLLDKLQVAPLAAGEVFVKLNLGESGFGIVFLNWIHFLVVGIAFVIILRSLRNLLNHYILDEIFTVQSVRQIRWIAWSMVSAAGAQILFNTAFVVYALYHMGNGPVSHTVETILYNLDFTLLFSGLLVLIVAEVFAEGATMRSEQDFTV